MVNEVIASDVADTLQGLMEQTELAQGYRDPSIPEGAVLAVSRDAAGAEVRWTKPSSMVRAGKTPLPERFEAYDTKGNLHRLPTAMMTMMLSKPKADAPGVRAFHTHTGGKTRETCSICPEDIVPFEGTCDWCLKRTNGAVRKQFEDEDKQIAHYRAFHEQEYGTLQTRLDREERRAQIEAQNRIAEAMLASVQQNSTPALACDECGWTGKDVAKHKARAHKDGE